MAGRAASLCEYCLLHEEDTFFGCEVDHIVSQKHGGTTTEENLAYACLLCNRNKGSDIASLVPESGQLVRLFHPRRDVWGEHFLLDEETCTIKPITPIGEATERMLGLNKPERLLERQALQAVGRYPVPAARNRMKV